jgi:hypothetical protein
MGFEKGAEAVLQIQSATAGVAAFTHCLSGCRGLAESLRNLIPTCFSTKNGMYHYLHMAKGNFRE